MNKYIIRIFFITFFPIISCFAQNNIEDYAQDRPKSRLQIKTTQETIKTTGSLDNGVFVAESEQKLIEPKEENVFIEPAKIPKGEIIFPDKNLAESIKALNNLLDAISKDNILEAQKWASQVSGLLEAENSNLKDKQIMQYLRKELIDMEVAFNGGDYENITKISENIAELRKKERYFFYK